MDGTVPTTVLCYCRSISCEVGQYCSDTGCQNAALCETNDGSSAAPTDGCICIYYDAAAFQITELCHGTYCDTRGCTSRTVLKAGLIILFVIVGLCCCCVIGTGVYFLIRRRARDAHIPASVELQFAETEPTERAGQK